MKRAHKLGLMSFLLVVVALASAAEPGVVPLTRCHAHNDYMHARPLLDALDCGFCSVEADIHLVDGQLLVAHDRRLCKPERTLQALYLEPLRARCKANGGRVYPNGPKAWLLVDFKTGGAETYPVFDKVLREYADILTQFKGNDVVKDGAITVVVDGAREQILGAGERFCAMDGNVGDLDSDLPVTMMPWISQDWKSVFKWRGDGAFPDEEKAKLDDIVRKAHAKNRVLRFWGLPYKPDAVWPVLYDAGVDLLNADNLKGMQEFLLKKANR